MVAPVNDFQKYTVLKIVIFGEFSITECVIAIAGTFTVSFVKYSYNYPSLTRKKSYVSQRTTI